MLPLATLNIIADECERQQVGPRAFVRCCRAYDYAYVYRDKRPTIHDILNLGSYIEPCNNRGFRRTPVVFANSRQGIHHTNILPAIERLIAAEFDGVANDRATDIYVKEFLDIHPFEDGNGRTAFILYNWLNETLANPKPLPDYYG
jgi:Fic/DOC family